MHQVFLKTPAGVKEPRSHNLLVYAWCPRQLALVEVYQEVHPPLYYEQEVHHPLY